MANVIKKQIKKVKRYQQKNDYIHEIMKATGWERKKALSEINQAKQAGMPYFRYVKNKCWELNLEEIKALNEEIEHRLAEKKRKEERKRQLQVKKEKHICEVMEATGWEREKALSEMEQAKQAGMPYFRYVKNKCWELNPEEIKALNEKIEHRLAEKKRKEERKRQLQVKKEKHICEVMEATGWEREKALSEMEQAKQAGMPYFRYVKNRCWELNLEEIKNLNEKIEHRLAERKRKKEERKQQLQAKKENYIREVMEATGWEREKALSEMEQAKQAGMSYFRYVKNKCWELNLEEIKNLNEEIEHQLAEKNEAYILKVCEEAGWPREKAIKKLKQASRLGVSNYQYAFKYLFQLTQEELEEFSRALKEKKKVLDRDNRFYVDMVCLKTGWDADKAKQEMQSAKKAGVSYLKYIQKQLWDSNNKEQVISELIKDKDRIAANKNTYAEKICEKTGWSRGKTELEVLKANINCGASYEDYLAFRFYEKSPEEQRNYVTLGLFNKMRIRYNDHYKSAANFDNKVAFNNNFKDYIKHRWFFNKDLSYEKFSKAIEGLDKIIVKPLAATQGLGIKAYQCNLSEEDNLKLYQNIIQSEESIVEEFIVQHDQLSRFCKSIVNTIRITTLNFNGSCKFLYSVLRMGRDDVCGGGSSRQLPCGRYCGNHRHIDRYSSFERCGS